MGKQVIITGGRDYNDSVMVNDVLDFLAPDWIVQGGATGADRLALEYAKDNNIQYDTVEADWSLGRKAGPLRNQKMLDKYPNAIVVAFPGGSGTENCVKEAVRRNMIVLRVEP